jgi:hypothetical protein
VKVFTVAHLPPELANAWMQHLRDFDVAHEGCHFDIMVDAPEKSLLEMMEMIRIKPGLSFTQIIELEKS